MARLAAAGLAVAILGACGSDTITAGPISMQVPAGWQVTRSGTQDLQMADGTAGRDGAPGSASAVFDVYLRSRYTPSSFEAMLRRLDVGELHATTEAIDGVETTLISYAGEAFAGRQVAALIPEYRIHIVYRAAFPHDDEAFEQGLDAFHEAVRSIRFTRPPPRDA